MSEIFRNRTFRGDALGGEDLSHADFTGCTFVDIAWAGRDLEGSVLEGARFEGGDISGASFSGCDLTRTHFREVAARAASFQNATFDHAELVDADLTDSTLTGAAFSNAIILGGLLTGADFSFATFRHCGFNFVRGEATNFTGCSFLAPTNAGQGTTEIELPLADFTRATLTDVNWPGAQLRSATFVNAKLNRVVLESSELDEADFTDAILKSVIFDGAGLSYAEFGETDHAPHVGESSLFFVAEPPPPVRLRDIGFREANLTNARFSGVVLTACDLRNANADAAEFMGTRFDGCELEGMNWTDVAPGWLTTDNATRRTMIDLFLREKMALPYVPLDEGYDIVQDDETQFRSSSWHGIDPVSLYYVDHVSEQLRNGTLADGFAIGMNGHGANSYAWTYACTESRLSVVAQIYRGKVFHDPESQTLRWDVVMRGVARLFERSYTQGDQSRLLVEFSDMRGIAQWRWIRVGDNVLPVQTDPRATQLEDSRIVQWEGDRDDVAGFFRAAAVEAAKL